MDEVTYRGYLQTAQTQVLPYFDENALRLSECTAEVLQDYFDEKFKSGRLFGKLCVQVAERQPFEPGYMTHHS